MHQPHAAPSASGFVPAPQPAPIIVNVNNTNTSSSSASAAAAAGGLLVGVDGRRMHWIYFAIVGWWLGLFVACCIFPLLTPGGRRVTAATFGYW